MSSIEPLEGRRLFSASAVDATFGVDGRSPIDIEDLQQDGRVVSVLPDGKILVAGDTTYDFERRDDGIKMIFSNTGFLARLNPDGTPDLTFGTNGVGERPPRLPDRTAVPWEQWPRHVSNVSAMAVQADGKVLIGGTIDYHPTAGTDDRAFAVVRYNTDGSLDRTFGSDGLAIANLFTDAPDDSTQELVRALAVDAEGRIVAAGFVTNDGSTDNVNFDQFDVGVARFNADGTVDPSLTRTEKFPKYPTGRPRMEKGEDVVIQADGKVVVAATVGGRDGVDTEVGLLRFNADGTLDGSFGTGGHASLPVTLPPDGPAFYDGHAMEVQDLVVAPDGKLVVAGRMGKFDELGVARFNPDGTPDATFSGDGITIGVKGVNAARYVIDASNPDTLTVAGVGGESEYFSLSPDNPNHVEVRWIGAAAVRVELTAAGAVSSSARVSNATERERDYFASLALDGDGKILAVGNTSTVFDTGFAAELIQDALVVRIDSALLTPDDLTSTHEPPSTPPPTFAGKASVRAGKAYKFKLVYATAEEARDGQVVIVGPDGAESSATLTKLKVGKARRGSDGAVTATYSVTSPASAGTYDVALRDAAGTLTPAAATFSQAGLTVVGNFDVIAAKSKRRAPVGGGLLI